VKGAGLVGLALSHPPTGKGRGARPCIGAKPTRHLPPSPLACSTSDVAVLRQLTALEQCNIQRTCAWEGHPPELVAALRAALPSACELLT